MLLDLVASVLHEVLDVLQMSLYNQFHVLLTLIELCSSLQFLVLLLEEEIQLTLLGLNHLCEPLVRLSQQLVPLVGMLL